MLSVYYGSCTDWRWLLYGIYRNSSFPVTATDVSMETALTPSRETAKVIDSTRAWCVVCVRRVVYGMWFVVCGLGRVVCGVGCGAGAGVGAVDVGVLAVVVVVVVLLTVMLCCIRLQLVNE
jgi:hypothetical protein